MKKPPQLEYLEQTLRSSRLSARGFLGTDQRSLWEILDADASEVEKLGYTMTGIATRMHEITDRANEGLGDWVEIGKNIKACTTDVRGVIACPWPHAFRANKTVTTVLKIDSGDEIKWADLNIHLIEEHGFFQGKGSVFRLEPSELVKIIF
ncbi:hypothetical protein JXM67_07695 [candidate division WOR-3 bacterium]|nr:hypothetical protein [candidate division WOR-3 bacterium]